MKTAEDYIIQADAAVADRPAPSSSLHEREPFDAPLTGLRFAEEYFARLPLQFCAPAQSAPEQTPFHIASPRGTELNQTPWRIRSRAGGTEALAFYKSPRFLTKGPFPGRWGIFYFADAIDWLALEITLDAGETFVSAAHLQAARRLLREHELLHFEVDIWCAGLELVLESPRYRLVNHPRTGIPAMHQVEEALANQRSLQWAAAVGLERFAHRLFRQQPGAYARYIEPEAALRAELAGNYARLSLAPVPALAALAPQGPAGQLVDLGCPEWIIGSSDQLGGAFRNEFDAKYLPQYVGYEWRLSEEAARMIKKSGRKTELERLLKRAMKKVCADGVLHGLDCKSYRGEGIYTIRLNDGDRASFRVVDEQQNMLEVVEVGTHAEIAE